jgi:hypothetical protein
MKISKSQIILIAIFALFLPLNLFIRTSFAQGTVVEVRPNAISAEVGQSFAINITVVDVQSLYALDVTVNWNPYVLQLVNIDVRLGHTDTDGVLYNSSLGPVYIQVNSTYPGNYEIAATSEDSAPPFNGTGNIVRITFNVTGSGYSSIDFSASQLWDYALLREPPISMPIEHSTVGGEFNTPVVEIPNSAILLVFTALTTSALALSKKMTKKVHLRPVSGDIKQDLLTEGRAQLRGCRRR